MEVGTRLILPDFEDIYAFKKFMSLIARTVTGNEMSRVIQMQLENEIDESKNILLTDMDKLQYFRNIRKNLILSSLMTDKKFHSR